MSHFYRWWHFNWGVLGLYAPLATPMAQAMIFETCLPFRGDTVLLAEVIVVVVVFNLARFLIKLLLQNTAHNKKSVMT